MSSPPPHTPPPIENQDLVDDADYAASQENVITNGAGPDSSSSQGPKPWKYDPNSKEQEEIVFIKDNVAVHPTQNAQQRISGRLCILKHGSSLSLTWIPYSQRNEEVPDPAKNDRLLYTIRGVPLSKVRSIRRNTPPLGWQYIIIVLTSGLAFPPLYFHNGGIKEFLATLKEYVHIIRFAEDANLFLVNDISQDPLQRSLSSLELRDVVSTAALPRPDQNISQESLIGDQTLHEASQVKQDNESSVNVISDSARQQQRRVHDPAHDISIQVLEKFSLVTKFARDTTAQLFGERRLLGGSHILEDVDPLYKVMKQEATKMPLKEPIVLHNNNLPVEPFKDSFGVSDAGKAPVSDHVPPLSSKEWLGFFDNEGRIVKSQHLRELIFYGGIQHDLRIKVWKFLLGFFPYESTYKEREELRSRKGQEYKILKSQWQTILDDQARRFTKFRERRSRIEKDVVRTDRDLPFYAGDDNPNVVLLRDILMTYSFYNFDLGYCQGMSDFLSPILYVMEDESDAFWCFVSLMEHMGPNFHRDQNGMHSQLLALSKLVELLDRPLHVYLKQADCLNYFFCFRWLLIQFKREFVYEDVLCLWERLWTNHLTEHLHLYMCVALLKTYKKKIMEEEMDFDTLLKFINELSGHIDLKRALRDAESLFYVAGDLGTACIPPGTPPTLQIPNSDSLMWT